MLRTILFTSWERHFEEAVLAFRLGTLAVNKFVAVVGMRSLNCIASEVVQVFSGSGFACEAGEVFVWHVFVTFLVVK